LIVIIIAYIIKCLFLRKKTSVQYASMERHIQEKANSDLMWQLTLSDLQKRETLLKWDTSSCFL